MQNKSNEELCRLIGCSGMGKNCPGDNVCDILNKIQATPPEIDYFPGASHEVVCPTCGHHSMVRNGVCYKCIVCGTTTGCS